jgi:hypothetical protein
MPVATSPAEAASQAFEKHACLIAPIAFGVGVAAPEIAAVAIPAALLAAGRCLGAPYQTPPPPGVGIPFLGGQCAQYYQFSARFKLKEDGTTNQPYGATLFGPVQEASAVKVPSGGRLVWKFYFKDAIRPEGEVFEYGLDSAVWDLDYQNLVPAGGASDNCGNPPITPQPPYPPLPPFPPPDTNPVGRPVLPPGDYPIPYQPDPTYPPIFLPIGFPPIVIPIAPTFPITIPVNVGGVKVGDINLSFNGTFSISFDSPTPESKDYTDLLNAIKECACRPISPPPSSEAFAIPYVEDGSCTVKTTTIQVVSGGIPSGLSTKLAQSAATARLGCLALNPVQESETAIFSGTATFQTQLFYSPALDPKVVSVRLQITQSNALSDLRGGAYPTAGQKAYGVIGFSQTASGGGGEEKVYDASHLYRLNKRVIGGNIKVLLKPGTAFTLYDTGERIA